MKNFKEANSKTDYIISFICDALMLLCTTSTLVFANEPWWLKFIYLIWHSNSIAILVMDIKNYKEFKYINEHR